MDMQAVWTLTCSLLGSVGHYVWPFIDPTGGNIIGLPSQQLLGVVVHAL
jgi:hypothetical protein